MFYKKETHSSKYQLVLVVIAAVTFTVDVAVTDSVVITVAAAIVSSTGPLS
jgi:hypothetical protein